MRLGTEFSKLAFYEPAIVPYRHHSLGRLQFIFPVAMVCRVPAPVYVQLYQLVAILIGVVGNSFVIYASKQYSTFNLDRFV